MLLAQFIVKSEVYEVYGSHEICEGKDCALKPYRYVEFYDVSAKMIVNGASVDFIPEGCSWNGRKYQAEDMISDLLYNAIRGCNTVYEILYLEPALKALVEEYCKDAVIVSNELILPKRVLFQDLFEIGTLMLVTNDFIYYGYGEDLLMLCTDTREVISDNYFASVGYMDTCDNIHAGKETVLWRNIEL